MKRRTITVWEYFEAWQRLSHVPLWRRPLAHWLWWFRQGMPDVIDPRE